MIKDVVMKWLLDKSLTDKVQLSFGDGSVTIWVGCRRKVIFEEGKSDVFHLTFSGRPRIIIFCADPNLFRKIDVVTG